MGVINAGILAGILAVGIPIAIHLLRSRRFTPAYLGTLRFLRRVLRENARWRKLRELLLLLARILIVVLLAFLFARPFLKDTGESEEESLEALFLVDASGSMSGRNLGERNFDLAREKAEGIRAKLPASASVTMAAFADEVREIRNPKDWSAISLAGRTDYTKALRWASDRLNLSRRTIKEVYLITDSQKTGLASASPKDWPMDAVLRILPAQPAGAWNAAITSVRNPSPYLGAPGEIEVSLACFGDAPAGEIGVTLEMEGDSPRTKKAALKQGAVVFDWVPRKPGLYRGKVRIQGKDAYPFDDERVFAIRMNEPRRVLLVDGSPGKTPFEQETYFLETALNVTPAEKSASPFKTQRVTSLGNPEGFGAVALCNVRSLEADEMARLSTFVSNGGGLVHFLGDRVALDSYSELAAKHLFPARLTASKTTIPRQITDWDKSHPALSLFDSGGRGDLLRVVFREAFQLEPEKESRVLARFSDGLPAIVESAFGKGRILVVANPCDRDWSDWPAERIFLPLMREIFEYLAGASSATPRIQEKIASVNDPAGPGIWDGDPVTVVSPDPAEADIRGLDAAAFRKALGFRPEPLEAKVVAESRLPRPDGSERKNEIWLHIALSLWGVMLLENTLADWGRA